MTQLTNNFNAGFQQQQHQMFNCNTFGSPQNSQSTHYYVQEPHGKRPFPVEFEADMEYVPRTKRRFDKISACLENFSISNDAPAKVTMDSSSDEEMEEAYPEQANDEVYTASSSAPLVVEPDDEPAVAKKIRLDESIQRYLDRLRKDYPIDFLPKREKLKGHEMVVWQPRVLISPKNDFNMVGRIQEIDDEEEERVNEEIKERTIENEGMVDASAENVTTGIVELESDNSDIGSSWSSPIPSPTNNSQVVELDDDSPNSLTNGSVSDEEMMEFDD